MRDPDYGFSVRGEVRTPRHTWQAWSMPLPKPRGARLGLWLLQCPFAHSFWHQWVLILAHLRPGEGLPAPVGSGHELAIFAVDPQFELTADVEWPAGCLMYPPVCVGFDRFGDDDQGALERVELLIEATMRRQLSPDDDYRRTWENLLRA